MKAAVTSAMLALSIGAIAIGGCEKSTDNRSRTAADLSASREQSRVSERPHEESWAQSEADRAYRTGPSSPAIGGGPSSVPSAQTTGAEALWRIAVARCNRELRCQNVGSSAKYKSLDDCISGLKNDKGSDFTAQSCPDGVSESALSSCLEAIRDEGCGSGLAATARATTCRAERFCNQPVPGGPSGPASGSTSGG